MRLMKWTEQVQDRPKWKDIVEKSKTIRVVASQKKKMKKKKKKKKKWCVCWYYLVNCLQMRGCE